MNFTNINDPAGVSALLEKLRSSQAWADLEAQGKPSDGNTEPLQTAHPVQPSAEITLNNEETKPSVASLLFQLSSSPASVSSSTTTTQLQVASLSSSAVSQSSAPLPMPSSSRQTRDVRNHTFQQALPHLAQLSDDPTFVAAILKLRQDQNDLEKRLWEERQSLHAKQAEKVKVAVMKAKMLGTGLSEHEANVMRQHFDDELSKFDRERVLHAWDALVARQQAGLEKLGVPAMFVTEEGPDRERQQRVIQVLEGIVGTDEPDRAS